MADTPKTAKDPAARTQPRFYYGWVIVAVMGVVTAVSLALGGVNFGFFIKPMSDDLGISQAFFGWAQTARLVGFALTSFLVGKVLDRFGARIPLAIAAALMGGAVFALALVTEGWQLIALFFFIGAIGMQGGGGNLYSAVPLEASHPGEWREDLWVVAAEVFAPCYIGGWSACEHWGLTDQLFRDVVVLTSRWMRNRRPTIQGTRYRVKVISPERLFGTRIVWRGRVRVHVSDPARTILDLLDDPGLGGGIRHVADVLREWFVGELRDDHRLLEYAERLGNRSVYKRLGFLIERLAVPAPDLLEACERRMSTGVVRLDPSGPTGGWRVKRWKLIANATITGQAE